MEKTVRTFTEKQKEKIRKELSLNNLNSKYVKFVSKLHDRFNAWQNGRAVFPANNIGLEWLLSEIRLLKPNGHGFLIPLPKDGPRATQSVSFYYEILNYGIDEIILMHTKIQQYKSRRPEIIVNYTTIVEEIDKQVKEFLRKLKETK